jgi:hypothetical protein
MDNLPPRAASYAVLASRCASSFDLILNALILSSGSEANEKEWG